MIKKDKYFFEQKTNPYINKLSKTSKVIKKMYFFDKQEIKSHGENIGDLLNETEHTVVKGLVHKYNDRVLILLSYTCAANCVFCERQGRVGSGLDVLGFLTENDILGIYKYIKGNKNIKEVVFSGGDPLMNSKGLLFACKKISKLNHIKILRIHTKLPISGPQFLNYDILEEIIKLPQICYFSIHVNHPDELTKQSRTAIEKIRKMGYIMLNQSIFLKGINDNLEILKSLFSTLAEMGVRPYYMYHCNSASTKNEFVMDIADEISLMTNLREQISGIAFPQHSIDAKGTTGKVIVPTNHWSFDCHKMKDFKNNEYIII